MLICPRKRQDVPELTRFWKNWLEMFNLSHHVGILGAQPANRSADVIALKRTMAWCLFIMDSIGLHRLQGFLDKQPELPSVLMMITRKCVPRRQSHGMPESGGLNMNFEAVEELKMMMLLINTGTRMGLIHELRLGQCT